VSLADRHWPLLKTTCRPLNGTIEYILGLNHDYLLLDDEVKSINSDYDDVDHSPPKSAFANVASATTSAISHLSLSGAPAPVRSSIRVVVKVVTTALVVLIAIYLPGFEQVMSFLGSFSAFVICVHGPILANLALNWQDISRAGFVVDCVLLAISTGELPLGGNTATL
jgi:hypothetical protein